ncbi:uncharacterized protein ACN427_009419 [Glossina fuscipes fuscipes]
MPYRGKLINCRLRKQIPNGGVNNMSQFAAFQFATQMAASDGGSTSQAIDWAQLAQQWIQMRDSNINQSSEDTTTIANKHSGNAVVAAGYEEKGEADMDMEDDEQNDAKSSVAICDFVRASSSQSHSETSTSPQNLIQNPNLGQPWYMQQCSLSNLGPSGSQIGVGTTAQPPWNIWQTTTPATPTISNPVLSVKATKTSTSHIPSLLEITVPSHSEIKAMPDTPNESESSLDAAKRKILPAWLREGLEKMEREKQKQLERQQKHKELSLDNKELNKDITVNPLKTKISDVVEEGDEESSGNEAFPVPLDLVDNQGSTRFADKAIPALATREEGKSFEQKLEELMIVVRRTLTELLLEVTNNEISQVANDTLKAYKSKASSAQVIGKSALASITGKLGLAAYGDSSSDENSDSDDQEINAHKSTENSESDYNSEEEIKNEIRSKKLQFAKISDDIEERVAMAASREEEKVRYYTGLEEQNARHRSEHTEDYEDNRERKVSSSGSVAKDGKNYEREFGETTESKLHHSNGKRHRERSARKERTTRFSDNKDNKAVSLTAATCSYISQLQTNSQPKLPALSANSMTADPNGLIPNAASVSNLLNTAGNILEEAAKLKYEHKSARKRQRREYEKEKRVSSRSASSSSKSSSSSSDSSKHSKYSNSSTIKRKLHKHSKSISSKSTTHDNKERRRDDRRSHSSSHSRRERDSSGRHRYNDSVRRRRRHHSSDSDDEYRYSSHSHSHSHSHSSSKRDRSRSRSKSFYSSSSKNRH